MNPLIILATTSSYRKSLFNQLKIPFSSQGPNVDEEAYKRKISDPFELTKELSYQKAFDVSKTFAGSLVIGGDQMAFLGGELLGKPGTQSKAIEQLKLMNGKTHELYTSICVLWNEKRVDITVVAKLKMRQLTDQEIESYVRVDNPIDSAGSYKLEKKGIALFESIECDDFSSIQGIPLIKLTTALREMGVSVF